MIKLYRLLTATFCFLIFFSPLALAQTPAVEKTEIADTEKYYDVEIIVFKFNTPIISGEVNLPTPSAIRTSDTIDFSSQEKQLIATEKGFSPLVDEDLRLLDVLEKINASSRYTVLTHFAWRQPGLGEADSLPVWIKGGKIYGKGYSSIDQMMVETQQQAEESKELSNLNEINTSTDSSPATDTQDIETSIPAIRDNEFYELDGQITIILSRYLHTKTDLVFRQPSDIENVELTEENRIKANMDIVEGQLLLNYGLNEKRRMRSTKLHYLDNPKFGMLVLITPYEPEVEVEPAEAANNEELPVPSIPAAIIAQ